MINPRHENTEVLSAWSWAVRTSAEAQVRALTALQRCTDDYRRTHDPDALVQIGVHLATVERRIAEIGQALSFGAQYVARLEATHV